MAGSEQLRQQREALRSWFRELPSGKRDNLIKAMVVCGGVVVLLSAYYLTGRDKKVHAAPKEKVAVLQVGDARLQDDIRAQVERERDEQRNRNALQDKTIAGQREQLDAQGKQIDMMRSVLEAMQQGTTTAFPSAEELAAHEKGTTVPQRAADWEHAPTKSGATLASVVKSGASAVGAAREGLSAEGESASATPTLLGEIGIVTPPKDPSAASPKKKTRKFFLPTSFMPAKLLTGLSGKTIDSAKEDPEPMVLRVQAPAVLPNDVRAALDGCLVVAHGYGSLASERIETRLVSLSCMDFDGHSVIEQELTGIVVDQDAVKGLVAHPVTKMGANVARLALAGLIEGGARAFEQTAVTTSISPLGQTQSLDTDKLARAAVGRGASNAAGEISKIFADLARQSGPVLELGPTKDVTVVVTQGVWLEVKDYEQES